MSPLFNTNQLLWEISQIKCHFHDINSLVCHILSRRLHSLVGNFSNEENCTRKMGNYVSPCFVLFWEKQVLNAEYKNKWQFCRAQSGRAGTSSRNVNGRVSHSECEYPTSTEPGVCALLLLTIQSWQHIWHHSRATVFVSPIGICSLHH